MKASELELQPMTTAPKDETLFAWVTFKGDYGYTEDSDGWAKIRYWVHTGRTPGGYWTLAQPSGRYNNGITPIGWLLVLDNPVKIP